MNNTQSTEASLVDSRSTAQFTWPRDFEKIVREQADQDPNFRRALLQEAVQLLLSGDTAIGCSVLRDYISATVGFEELGRVTDQSPESLMRMLSPGGEPRASDLLTIVARLQAAEGVQLTVKAEA